jgi:4-hydroxy-tetrahydrodipicolinate reductase
MPAREVRAIVYGVGAMGSLLTRLLLDKGVQITGAVGRSPEKVGRDLGEVARLGRHLGVAVESDPREALAKGADIAVVCVSSYLDTMRDHFAVCLEHGVNVVTIEEETVFPWNTAPDHAVELDALAKANGVSLAASGAQDVFWLHLVGTLLGASHSIEAVDGRCSWNVDDYGPEVANHVHVGDTAEVFERHVTDHGWPEFVARQNLEALVAELELSVANISSHVSPVLADQSTFCVSLNRMVPPGRMLGTVDTTEIETNEGPRFSFAMEGRVYREGEADTNEWHVRGEPELHLRNDRVPYRFITCSSVVNRIPDVIRAEPGLITLDRLGKPSYKHGALAKYLR